MNFQNVQFKTPDIICYAAVCIYQGILQISLNHCSELKNAVQPLFQLEKLQISWCKPSVKVQA